MANGQADKIRLARGIGNALLDNAHIVADVVSVEAMSWILASDEQQKKIVGRLALFIEEAYLKEKERGHRPHHD